MKIGRASASSARSTYRIMRIGMGVSDAFKAWVLKRFPGERGAGGASVLSTRGAEAYMSRRLCDYFVTVGSRVLGALPIPPGWTCPRSLSHRCFSRASRQRSPGSSSTSSRSSIRRARTVRSYYSFSDYLEYRNAAQSADRPWLRRAHRLARRSEPGSCAAGWRASSGPRRRGLDRVAGGGSRRPASGRVREGPRLPCALQLRGPPRAVDRSSASHTASSEIGADPATVVDRDLCFQLPDRSTAPRLVTGRPLVLDPETPSSHRPCSQRRRDPAPRLA